MNLDHLRYFAAIAQLQHYGKAAEQLHVSQPNLNYAVSQLETELGVPLFEKSGRNVRLTRYGKEFLPSVQRTLETLDAGTRSIRELGQNGGLVLLGSIRKLGTSLVPELMRDFRQQEEPAVRFQLHTEGGFSADLLKAVEEGRLDMAFTSQPGDPVQFESIAFRRSPFVVITPLEHPLAGRSALSLQETLSYPQVCFAPPLRPAAQGGSAVQPDRGRPADRHGDRGGCRRGRACGRRVRHCCPAGGPLFRSLPLAVISLTDPDPARTAYLSRRRGTRLPEASRRFYEFCCRKLEEPAP